MKKVLAALALVMLVLRSASEAFSLDTAIQNYIGYLKSKIAVLEAENAKLKAQVNSCGEELGTQDEALSSERDTNEEATRKKEIEVAIASLRAENLKIGNFLNDRDHYGLLPKDEVKYMLDIVDINYAEFVTCP